MQARSKAPFAIADAMPRRAILAGMAALLAPRPAFAETRVDAGQFGAVGDGRTLATRAIQAAIDAAAKTGGTLLGSRDLGDYPMLATRVAGIETI